MFHRLIPADLKAALQHMRHAGISTRQFLLPGLFGLIASICEGFSLALLIPALISIEMGTCDIEVTKLPAMGQVVLELLTLSTFPRCSMALVLSIFMFTFTKLGLGYVSTIFSAAQMRSFSSSLRSRIYERYLSFGKLFFDRSSTGELLQVLTTYVTMLVQSLQTLNSGVYVVATLAVYLFILCSLSLPLTACVLLVFPVLHFSLRGLIKKIQNTSDAHTTSYDELGKQISNALQSIGLVKSSNTEEYEAERFRHLSDQVAALEYSIYKKTLLVGPIQEGILLAFLLLLIGLIAGLGKYTGTTTLAESAVFLLVLKRAATQFGVVNTLKSNLAMVHGPLTAIEEMFSDTDKFFVPSGVETFTSCQDSIAFKNLSFTYPDGIQALHDVNFEVEAGSLTALIGQTGSGKSSIAQLLLRFYDPPPGTIFIDGIDIRNFSHESLRAKIAFVSQDAALLNATLRENLLYGLPGTPNEQELASALAQAQLSRFVELLPQGLESQIGDRGVMLSGGERQRVAIARAMLKQAPIVVLDEPTSALDAETEKELQVALDAVCSGKTVLVVAHRLATIKNADKIVVLDEGRIVEQGKMEELLENQGRFHLYWGYQQL